MICILQGSNPCFSASTLTPTRSNAQDFFVHVVTHGLHCGHQHTGPMMPTPTPMHWIDADKEVFKACWRCNHGKPIDTDTRECGHPDFNRVNVRIARSNTGHCGPEANNAIGLWKE